MTEVTLKLYPLPEAVSAAICHFPSIDAAVRTTIQIIQMGVPIARCELLDANAVRAVNEHDKLGLREAPMLLMEFHGSEAGVQEQAETVQAIAGEHRRRGLRMGDARPKSARGCGRRATTPTSPAADAARAAAPSPPTPACRSRAWPRCINASVAEADAAGLPYCIVGHVGDGNFHLGYLIDPNDPAETRDRPSA